MAVNAFCSKFADFLSWKILFVYNVLMSRLSLWSDLRLCNLLIVQRQRSLSSMSIDTNGQGDDAEKLGNDVFENGDPGDVSRPR